MEISAAWVLPVDGEPIADGRVAWEDGRIVEVGAGQAADVKNVFSSVGWSLLGERNDLGGHARAVALEIHS